MDEKTLEQKLVKAVKRAGGVAYKFISPGHNGVPDRLVVLPNRITFIEVKAPGRGRLSELQKFELTRLRSLGCECYVLNDPEQIPLIIEGELFS